MPPAAGPLDALVEALGRDEVIGDMIENLNTEYQRGGWVLCHESGQEVTLEAFRINVLIAVDGEENVYSTLDGAKLTRNGRKLTSSDPTGVSKSITAEDEATVTLAGSGKSVVIKVLHVTRIHFSTFVTKMKDPRSAKINKTIRKFYSTVITDIEDTEGKAANPKVQGWLPRRVLTFFEEINAELRNNPLWADADEHELKDADDAMQKYVLGKLYHYTFGSDKASQEMDAALAKTLERYTTCPLAFQAPPTCVSAPDFGEAVQHLVGVDQWKAPLDKLICLSNCCKVLSRCCGANGALPTEEQLTFCLAQVIHKAKPKTLISNIHYIVTYRPSSRAADSDSAYFLRCVRAAVQRWTEFSDVAGDVCGILSEARASLGSRGFTLNLPEDPERISLVDIQPLLLQTHALAKMEAQLRRYAGLPTTLKEEMRRTGPETPAVPKVGPEAPTE